MNRTKSNAIFYIDADNGFYYGGSQMLTLPFLRDVIADQDILNREKFYTLLKSFIETNKLEPSAVILVFAPGLCYDKSYDGTAALTEKDKQEMKDFLDIVPFEDVLSKQYKVAKKTVVVCINRDLAMTIKVGFEKEKFTVAATVPYSILQLVIPELAENVDFDLMLSRYDSLRQHNMIEVVQAPVGNKLVKEIKPKNSARLYGLVGLFGLLGVVLAFMVYNTFFVYHPKPDGTIGGSRRSVPAVQTPVQTAGDSSSSPETEKTVPLNSNPLPGQINTSTPSAIQQ